MTGTLITRPGGEGSTTGVSRFVFGIRYIDDIVMRQRDANASGPPEERRYYLTDANYNVSMIVTDSGWGVERVFYTAYGEPEVFPFGDADGDYFVDGTDQSLIEDIKDSLAPYNILADLNLDGAVTQADLNAFTNNYEGYSGGRGVLAISNGSATTGNDIGYAGYTWNDERSQWHVRHREYDPKLGRFLVKDPLTYVSGWNYFEYLAAGPLHLTDPSGLQPVRAPVRYLPPVRYAPRIVPTEGSPFRTIEPGRATEPIRGPLPNLFPPDAWKYGEGPLPDDWRRRLPKPPGIPLIPWWVPEGPFEPAVPVYGPFIGDPGGPCGPLPRKPKQVPLTEPLPDVQPTREEFPAPDPLPPYETPRNYGQTCPNWYLDLLNIRKKAECNEAGGCTSGMPEEELVRRRDKAFRCLSLRIQECVDCYGGLVHCNDTHQLELRKAHQGWRMCNYYLGLLHGNYTDRPQN